MKTYFIVAASFASPFCSDKSEAHVEADTHEQALERFASGYDHPRGLFAADAYPNADAYHKDAKPLARWLCNHQIAVAELTKGMGAYTFVSHGPGVFEINGEVHTVQDPKAGRVVPFEAGT